MDFSILIPTMNARRGLFLQVLREINRQIKEIKTAKIEVLYESDNGEMTLGAKRNVLISRAKGKYCCFVDDDDVVSPVFLKSFLPMLNDDYDCASLLGAHYVKGEFNKLFYHSMDIPEWSETETRYLRSVSPLNMIKTDICRIVQYADIRNTEDHEFSIRLMQSGLLKKEFKSPDIPLYHYVDGVKEDREIWRHRWNGYYIRLYKSIISDSKQELSRFARI